MSVGVALILAVTLINSRGRIFWEDEVLAWVLLRDPSWTHMVHAWNLGADGGGFSFYVLGRIWFAFFGSSELAFRLFSSACFGLALVVMWRVLRRFYPVWVVALAVYNTMFFSPPLTMHYVEGRFYGLFVLSTSLAIWLVVRLSRSTASELRYPALTAIFFHSLLVTCHVLGVLYSALLLLAIILQDLLEQRRRTGLYLSVAASWLWLIPERTALLATSQVGKPHFWTKPPSLGQIVGAYSGSSLEILAALILLLLAVAFTLPRDPRRLLLTLRRNFQARLPVYVCTGCLLTVPICLLVLGRLGTWLFVDRYLQPVTLGLLFITAELLAIAFCGHARSTLWRTHPRLAVAATSTAGALFFCFLLFWVFDRMASYTPSVVDFTAPLVQHLPADLPVVVGDAFTFTELMSRQSQSGIHFVFLLDWQYAISPEAPRLEVTQYHLMENWKRAGIFPGHVEYMDAFMSHANRFLVIDNQPGQAGLSTRPETSNPIAERLSGIGGWEAKRYFTMERNYKDNQRDIIWLVCRNHCADPVLPIEVVSCKFQQGSSSCKSTVHSRQ